MKKAYLKLLGARVLPLVKRSQYGAANYDSVGNLPYLQGKERQRYAKLVVDDAVKEKRRINKEQEWQVWSIHADGTFSLLSNYGYSQNNVSRSDFRLL
jgi:hypothetical protein